MQTKLILVLFVGTLLGAQAARTHPGPAGPEHQDGLSASEVATQLSNPISNIWSLQYSSNFTLLKGTAARAGGNFRRRNR